MLNKELLRKLKEKVQNNIEIINSEDLLNAYEMLKEVYEKHKDLSKKLKKMRLKVQHIVSDWDKEFWFSVEDELFEYGEGVIEDPTFTFYCTSELSMKILFGIIYPTHPWGYIESGDIIISGKVIKHWPKLKKLLKFQIKELIELK